MCGWMYPWICTFRTINGFFIRYVCIISHLFTVGLILRTLSGSRKVKKICRIFCCHLKFWVLVLATSQIIIIIIEKTIQLQFSYPIKRYIYYNQYTHNTHAHVAVTKKKINQNIQYRRHVKTKHVSISVSTTHTHITQQQSPLPSLYFILYNYPIITIKGKYLNHLVLLLS